MIALGSDHGGFELKQEIMAYLKEKNIPFKDYGTYSTESCDYADYAELACNAIVAVREQTKLRLTLADGKCFDITSTSFSYVLLRLRLLSAFARTAQLCIRGRL